MKKFQKHSRLSPIFKSKFSLHQSLKKWNPVQKKKQKTEKGTITVLFTYRTYELTHTSINNHKPPVTVKHPSDNRLIRRSPLSGSVGLPTGQMPLRRRGPSHRSRTFVGVARRRWKKAEDAGSGGSSSLCRITRRRNQGSSCCRRLSLGRVDPWGISIPISTVVPAV